ncbi:MAG: histidine--tRNA ligase [Candidatus Diapherotrites archaeon]|uniref:Histidine--tRNA ligase n=1 Tax=Candidatus Iainarchaeum sp. TaxID=3101447 RepID=A0A8T4L9B4_9ARCH|nr:histidine--tRNA ligase [Candidatus Diapherotrites archaeon]
MTTFQNVRGTRDFLPERMKKKQFIEDTCRQVFELYGFYPLQTPALEELELLAKKGAGGQEISKEIYWFKDQGDRNIGLRFDLTVPMGRVVATNRDLSKPFKRYAIGQVWRYDRPGANRYREFTQADADTVGGNSTLADFEVIACALEIVKRLGLDAKVKVNNRKLLEELAKKCKVKPEQVVDCFRSLDKADKIEWKGVEKELKEKGIPTDILEVVRQNDAASAMKQVGKDSEGLKEALDLIGMLEAQGCKGKVQLDLSLARGLEYYTGNVFEVMVPGVASIAGGGRYDKLVGLYGGQESPATGISFGVDRLLDVLEDRLPAQNRTRVFVAPIGETALKPAVDLAQRLRGMGVNTDMDLCGRGISKNLAYASRLGVPFVLIVGEKDLAAGELTLKDLASGKETKLKVSDLNKVNDLVK